MLVPVYAQPGICKSSSDYASGKPFAYVNGRFATGRFSDGNNVEFIASFAQKIAGWTQATTQTMTGSARVTRSWIDLNGVERLGIGTSNHLYYWDGSNIVDITPHRTQTSGTLTNPFTLTQNSGVVAVADTSAQLANGDWVFLSAGNNPVDNTNNIYINGWYPVSSFVGGTGYNITLPGGLVAGGNESGVGGTTTFQYPRDTLGANPFTTVSGSSTVTVTDTAHGASTGDFVQFSGATTFNNVTISGEYQLTVVNANSFTITAATTANASGSGGGSAVSVTYNVTMTSRVFGAQTWQGWTLDRYGSQLLSCMIGGTIYVFDPAFGGRSYPLLNAPAKITSMFVTPERFVVALGVGTNFIEMAWSDQLDYTDWTSSAVNTANSGRVLQGGSYLVGGIGVTDGTSLLWSDRCCFLMTYTGNNEVYDTVHAGDNCGLVSPYAVKEQGGIAYWQSDGDFWQWSGGVSSLNSDDIRDYVFNVTANAGNATAANPSLAFFTNAGSNRKKRQIRFYYASSTAADVDTMVIYQVDSQCFSLGQKGTPAGRRTWCEADLFPNPFGIDVNNVLYTEETGTDANGASLDANLTFAPVDVSNGSTNLDILGFLPDFERLTANVTLTVNTRFYPQDANTSYVTTITDNDTTPRIDLRADGKMVGFEVDCNVLGGDFRLGVMRVDAQQASRRN